MRISINGLEKEVSSSNVWQMLIDLDLNPEITIVEKNSNIINRDGYKTEPLKNGDTFELIRFMGGG